MAPLVRDHPQGGEDGFALVSVLAVVAMLAFVSALLVTAVNGHIHSAVRLETDTRARLLAESAIAAVSFDLRRNAGKLLAGAAPTVRKEPITCVMDPDGVVAVRVTDPAGRVDLNTASESLLEALIGGLSEGGDPRSIALAIDARRTEWNQADGKQRRKFEPQLRPFETEESIRQIAGMTPRLAAAMRPYITVHSGTRGIDPNEADPELLALLQASGGGGISDSSTARSQRQAFVVTVGARAINGGSYGLEAIVQPTRDTRYPSGIIIRSWRPSIAVRNLIPTAQVEGPSCLSDGLFSPN